ncbi:unnamed protein product, partial [Discosporangium mesarthrocarpum]
MNKKEVASQGKHDGREPEVMRGESYAVDKKEISKGARTRKELHRAQLSLESEKYPLRLGVDSRGNVGEASGRESWNGAGPSAAVGEGTRESTQGQGIGATAAEGSRSRSPHRRCSWSATSSGGDHPLPP